MVTMRPDSFSHRQSTHRLPQQEMAPYKSEFEQEYRCKKINVKCKEIYVKCKARNSCQMSVFFVKGNIFLFDAWLGFWDLQMIKVDN